MDRIEKKTNYLPARNSFVFSSSLQYVTS